MAGNLDRKLRLPRIYFRVLLHAAKYATWDKRLYFHSEGRCAEDFLVLKNPMVSAGFEPASLGTKGQHATSSPPKPLSYSVTWSNSDLFSDFLARRIWKLLNFTGQLLFKIATFNEPENSLGVGGSWPSVDDAVSRRPSVVMFLD